LCFADKNCATGSTRKSKVKITNGSMERQHSMQTWWDGWRCNVPQAATTTSYTTHHKHKPASPHSASPHCQAWLATAEKRTLQNRKALSPTELCLHELSPPSTYIKVACLAPLFVKTRWSCLLLEYIGPALRDKWEQIRSSFIACTWQKKTLHLSSVGSIYTTSKTQWLKMWKLSNSLLWLSVTCTNSQLPSNGTVEEAKW